MRPAPDQLRHVLAELCRPLIAHPMILPDPMRMRFAAFGVHSLDIEVFAYITSAKIDAFTAAREDMQLRIMLVIGEAGAQFAFPSVIESRADDTPPDPDRTARAEAAVAQWGKAEDLPSPDFECQIKAELRNILDWPPRAPRSAGRAMRLIPTEQQARPYAATVTPAPKPFNALLLALQPCQPKAEPARRRAGSL